MKGTLLSVSWALGALCVLGSPSSGSAQPAAGEIVYGPSEAERLQLQEMTRSTLSNIRSLQDDSQAAKLNANGIVSASASGIMITPSAGQLGVSFSSFIWADTQGVWKLDKFGKQCAVASASGSSASSDPCS